MTNPHRYTLAELEAMPTLATGQGEDLKYEDNLAGIRIWLSRVGKDDGMPYDNQVTYERRYADGRGWYTYRTYQALS